ncbi:hypothetical protein QSI79_08370 [Enterobacter asburiae]|uniref:hypothetical protein n=1 Tax=Enterobacter asburiae TaxID=61645 RepID=UPI00287B0259|nr:hypothetical protein [Enterobacter asburiae]MDS1913312.1 hypothetical protein [Enterobacter asburiae]
MSTITKERINGIANGEKCYTHDDVVELASIALASLKAEAGEYLTHVVDDGYGEFSDRMNFSLPVGTKLYTAPPAPVSVPDESAFELLATDLMKQIDKITGERHSVATLSSLRVSIVEACRAAMLNQEKGNG